jgi:hypothetical protein
MVFLFNIPRPLTIIAMNKLAQVDYNVATKVSEDVAETVKWAYNHDHVWLANYAIDILQYFDSLGSILISIVAWIVHNTK